MDASNLLGVVLGMAGFGAFVSALVGVLKSVGLVQDGYAQNWVTGLNLLGVIGLYALGLSGKAVDMGAVDANLQTLATFLVAGGQLFVAMGGSKLFYGMVKGVPAIGKSFSE